MDEDQNSILFQAMQQQMRGEMSPPVDQVAMRRGLPPGSEYQLGLEMRQGGPGGVVTNPLRSARQPSDFAGRPAQANDNPASVQRGSPFSETPVRPSGNVINQYQKQWQDERLTNMLNQEMEKAAAASRGQAKGLGPEVRSNVPGVSQRALDWIRNFFNANRPPNSGLFD